MSDRFRSGSHLGCFAESYLEKFCAEVTGCAWRCVSVRHCPLLRFPVLLLHYRLTAVGASRAGVRVPAEPGTPAEPGPRPERGAGQVSRSSDGLYRFCVPGQRVRQMSFDRRCHRSCERVAWEVVCR